MSAALEPTANAVETYNCGQMSIPVEPTSGQAETHEGIDTAGGVEPISSEAEKRPFRYRELDQYAPLSGTLDSLLSIDHEIRAIRAYTQGLDYSEIEAGYKAVEGKPGAPLYPPYVLLTVILYGLIRGIFSFRELAETCKNDLVFKWICGGLTPSYHTLSTFYSSHESFLDRVFTELLAALKNEGLATFAEVTVDGRKVPANASKESMHRVKTLTEHQQEAEERLKRLKAERSEKSQKATAKEAAQMRAAEEKVARLKAAVDVLKKRTEERVESQSGKPEETRTSETDPDCRKMKMSNGGYCPAYNVQTVTDVETGLIVTTEVVDQASDNGLGAPMIEKAEEVTGEKVKSALLDGGYSSAADVEKLEKDGTEVLMPPKNEKKEKKAGKDPYKRKRRDSDEVAGWRERMGQEEYQKKYKRRAPVAEGTHARQSNRGFKRFRLRGLQKARIEVLWQALVHNLDIVISKKWISAGKICSQTA